VSAVLSRNDCCVQVGGGGAVRFLFSEAVLEVDRIVAFFFLQNLVHAFTIYAWRVFRLQVEKKILIRIARSVH
jgi:hypothetical protein